MPESSPPPVQVPKKKGPKKPVSRNAFTAFESEILQKVVLPKIAEVLKAHPRIEGKGGFLREFRKACSCRVSQGTMDEWLKKLGISFKRQVTVDFPENVQMTFEEIYRGQQKARPKNTLDGHPAESTSPIYCDHANEVPSGTCTCGPDCYCKQPGNTCAPDDFKFDSEHGKVK